MAFGLLDTQYIDFVEGQTDSRLRAMRNERGVSIAELYSILDGALAAVNQPDPLVAELSFRTTEEDVDVGPLGTKVFQRAGEFGPRRAQRIEGGGHKLPLYFNEIDLTLTDRGMKRIRRSKFIDEVTAVAQAIRRGLRADHLERLFDAAVWPLDQDGNGATPGFAGSGSGDLVFRGTLPNGSEVDASYTHYAYTTAGALETALDTYIARVLNWHEAPLDMIGSPAAIAAVIALGDGKFVPTGSALVRQGLGESEALVDPAKYVGVYKGLVRVRKGDNQIGEGAAGISNLAIFKTYGANNQRNPLRKHVDDLYGEGRVYVEERGQYPLAEAIALEASGVGVGSRGGAALISIGASQTEYTAPTIFR